MADLLNQKGFRAEVVSTLSRQSRLLLHGSRDTWIGLWNSVPLELLPKSFIFWNGEPVGHGNWEDDQDWSNANDGGGPLRWHESAKHRKEWNEAVGRSLAVWGYTKSCEKLATATGLPFTYVPFGYSAYYERIFNEVTGGKRPTQDIDVLFFGWTTERRQRLLTTLGKHDLNLVVINESRPVRGAELERLIARSKIVLGIYGYDDCNTHVPDFARFDFVFANQIFALHEKPSKTGQNLDFESHVAVSKYDELVKDCLYYLANPEIRDQQALRTYHWFKSNYDLASFLPFDSLRQINGAVQSVT